MAQQSPNNNSFPVLDADSTWAHIYTAIKGTQKQSLRANYNSLATDIFTTAFFGEPSVPENIFAFRFSSFFFFSLSLFLPANQLSYDSTQAAVSSFQFNLIFQKPLFLSFHFSLFLLLLLRLSIHYAGRIKPMYAPM